MGWAISSSLEHRGAPDAGKPDTIGQRSRTFRAVSAAETCPGNGDFNTDVTGHRSQPLTPTERYLMPPLDPGCSNYDGVGYAIPTYKRERDAEGTKAPPPYHPYTYHLANNPNGHGEELRDAVRVFTSPHVWFRIFIKAFGKMRQRSESRTDCLHELCIG